MGCRMRNGWNRAVASVLAALSLVLMSACGSGSGLGREAGSGRLNVVTTTGIIRDMVQHVAGDRANVVSLVPDAADPHSYEPSLRKVRDVVYADIAFSNYMLLEEHRIIQTLDANLRKGVPNIQLAEESTRYAAEVIPLVENVSLDTVWLGVAAEGIPADQRDGHIVVKPVTVHGPGAMMAYVTDTFGRVELYVDSSDGCENDPGISLPAGAHTHLSWAFTAPGTYDVRWQAWWDDGSGKREDIGQTATTFAVGVNARQVAMRHHAAHVLDSGHADLTVDYSQRKFSYRFDNTERNDSDHGALHREYWRTDDAIVEVPTKALHAIPPSREYRFLGSPRDKVYVLPQAVLGKHVHGEIDPHLWQNVRNGIAYVRTIAHGLSKVDPAHADRYQRNAASYIERLRKVDAYVSETLRSIPERRRMLVTTHDAFGYLAHAYGLHVAGFVTPNPSTEPSMESRKKLTQTMRDLRIPAVFIEANLRSRASVLQQVANDVGVRVCPIYGDSLDGKVTSYEAMMRFNADSIKECLS